MTKLQALIFDVDGTLADTEKNGHRVAFNAAFKQQGLNWIWTEDIYSDILSVAGGKERIKHYIEKYRPKSETLSWNEITNLHKTKTDFYTNMLASGTIPLRTGVKRLLIEARNADLRLAIATTTTTENVVALLTHTLGEESLHWFDTIAAGDVVAAKKPSPDIYFLALKDLGLPPQACMAFEDSANGIIASTGADLKTIITLNDYTRNHEFRRACLVLDQFGEPDNPFTVFQGNSFGFNFVNVEMLQLIHKSDC